MGFGDFNLVRSNPYYIVRMNIYQAVKKYACELKEPLLDFGCGSKPYRELFNHISQYIGLDFENNGHSHENESIDVFFDGKTIPCPDGHFNSVLSTEVFEHVFELDAILGEINRVMKPGANILITCPFVWHLHEEPHDFARYSPYALRYLFEKNGFEIVRIERRGGFKQAMAQLNIVYNLKHHILLKSRLFNSRLINNRIVSARVWLQKLIALYYNRNFSKEITDKVSTDDLYITNVVLARKSIS